MDIEERNRIVEENKGLVYHLARKYQSSGISIDDLSQTGFIGLIKAVESYNPNKGTKPATFFGRCIENQILMLLRGNKKHMGVMSLDEEFIPARGADRMSWYEITPDDKDYIEDMLDSLINTDVLEKNYHKLSEIERQAFDLRVTMGMKQSEVASKLGVSQSYVSRVVKKATIKLRVGVECGVS